MILFIVTMQFLISKVVLLGTFYVTAVFANPFPVSSVLSKRTDGLKNLTSTSRLPPKLPPGNLTWGFDTPVNLQFHGQTFDRTKYWLTMFSTLDFAAYHTNGEFDSLEPINFFGLQIKYTRTHSIDTSPFYMPTIALCGMWFQDAFEQMDKLNKFQEFTGTAYWYNQEAGRIEITVAPPQDRVSTSISAQELVTGPSSTQRHRRTLQRRTLTPHTLDPDLTIQSIQPESEISGSDDIEVQTKILLHIYDMAQTICHRFPKPFLGMASVKQMNVPEPYLLGIGLWPKGEDTRSIPGTHGLDALLAIVEDQLSQPKMKGVKAVFSYKGKEEFLIDFGITD